MGLICSSNICTSCPACPCCGYSSKAMVRQELKDMLKTWMKRLADLSPETKLRNLALMASHDSGTYSISKATLGSSVSRTQALDLYEQLDLGVRQIDIRYGPSGKKSENLAVRHGPHSGANYFGELIKVKNWIEDNPHEFLILDARCEKKVSLEQRNFLVHFLIEKFGKVMITKKDCETWFKVSEVTLGDLSKNYPKRVLLLVDQMVTDFPSKTDSPQAENLLNRDLYVKSPWHNTASVKKLFEAIERDSYDPQLNRLTEFFNHQLILTPKLSVVHVSKYCFCLDSGRIDQKQLVLFKDKRLQLFVRDMGNQSKPGQMNFIMMDFINYDPTIIQYLIGLNFPQELEIKSAVVMEGNLTYDVTKTVDSLVSRGNSLWIICPNRDLGIKKFKCGDLHLVYSYNGSKPVHKKIELKKGSEYLLNCFTHLDVTLDADPEDTQTFSDFQARKSEVFGEEVTEIMTIQTEGSEPRSSPCLGTRENTHHMCSPLLPNLNETAESAAHLEIPKPTYDLCTK